jgi:flagellar hook-length control protein FliK
MNVSNGMKLGFPQAAQAAGKSNSSAPAEKAGSAFGDVLGQVKNDKKSQDDNQKPVQKDNRELGQRAAPKSFAKTVAKRGGDRRDDAIADEAGAEEAGQETQSRRREGQGEVLANNTGESALPMNPGSGFQGVQGPAIADRVVTANTEIQTMTGSATKTPVVKTDSEEVDGLTRRVVWNDFLRKMKDDLGVSADDVMQAFASLSDEELAMPPQQTLDKVVFALGLDPAQSQVAKTYFQELVQKTKSESLGSEIAAGSKQIDLTLMSQREIQRKTMQKSIEKLGQNFFMNSPEQLQAQMQARMAAQQMAMNGDMPAEKRNEGFVSPQQASPLMAGRELSPMMANGSQIPATASQAAPVEMLSTESTGKAGGDASVNKLVENMQTPAQHVNPADQKAIEALAKEWNSARAGEMKNMAAAASAPAEGASKAASALAKPGPVSTPAGIAAALGGIFAAAQGEDSKDAGDDGEASFDQFAQMNQAIVGQNAKAGEAGAEFKTQLANAAQGPQQQAEIPDIISNAEVLLKDGGGEMKVTMKDEALGEVAMKVNVENGRVSVQMITESDEARKLIEKEMVSLKAHLGQHNLNVDQIKVDTATNMGNQLEQQYQDNQRQQAQNFMEQFRQEQQGWRRNILDVPGAKLYKGQSDANRDVQGPVTAKSKGNRRLNLVA